MRVRITKCSTNRNPGVAAEVTRLKLAFSSGSARRPLRASLPRLLHKGFTLVEILIAMGILSMVLAAIYTTWTAILRASKVGQDAAAAVQRARVAARTLEESLVSAQSFSMTEQMRPETYSFTAKNGDDAFLEFTSRLSKSFPRSGKFGDFEVRRVNFSLRASPDGGRELVLRQKPMLIEWDADTLIDEREHPVVLAKNVKAFKAEFWDPKRKEWEEEWDKTPSNTIPTLVKVTLKLGDNAHSSMIREALVRIVSVPAISVQPEWQTKAARMPTPLPGGQQGQPGQPGQPGGVNNPGGLPGNNTGGIRKL